MRCYWDRLIRRVSCFILALHRNWGKWRPLNATVSSRNYVLRNHSTINFEYFKLQAINRIRQRTSLRHSLQLVLSLNKPHYLRNLWRNFFFFFFFFFCFPILGFSSLWIAFIYLYIHMFVTACEFLESLSLNSCAIFSILTVISIF